MLGSAVVGHAMLDKTSGHGTITAVVIGLGLLDLVHHRPRDVTGGFIELAFHAVSSVMTGAALNRHHFGVGHELQALLRFHADFLHPLVAGDMLRHLAQRFLNAVFSNPA